MEQMSLIDTGGPHKFGDRWFQLFEGADPSLVKKFLDFHKKNPDLFGYFERFSQEAKASGRKYFSIWMIANRIRWYTVVETSGKEFKVSNDYLACYARLIVYLHPEFEGFFKLKKMKSFRLSARD